MTSQVIGPPPSVRKCDGRDGGPPLGAAQDLRAEEERIETLSPADSKSEALIRGMAAPLG